MADLDHRARSCLACHGIQRAGPKPHPGMLTPAAARFQRRAPSGRSRPIADPVPSRPGRHPLPRPHARLRSFTLTSSGSDDGLRRHPQDPDRPLQGLVAAG